MSTNRNKPLVSSDAPSSVEKSESVLMTVAQRARLLIMALLVVPTTALAGWSLYEIFRPNGVTELEVAQLGLALMLFSWLSMAFWTGIIGFVLQLLHIDPLSLKRQLAKPTSDASLSQRHAVVMPVYNETNK